MHKGSRGLTPAELTSVERALQGVTTTDEGGCWIDAPLTTLDVKTTAGLALYAADFDAGCPWEALAGRTFVTGLGDLGQMLWKLAP